MSGERRLEVSSLYGHDTRMALVQIRDMAPDGTDIRWQTQVTPEQARAHALAILASCEAAEMDEIVMRFLMERIGLDLEKATRVLMDFRSIRDRASLERAVKSE